jgi:hypothetical protein
VKSDDAPKVTRAPRAKKPAAEPSGDTNEAAE